jgi:hypothetical protein
MANGSPEIQSFIALRRELLARPQAGYWIAPLETYLELASDYSSRSAPYWWNPLTDTSAFSEQQHQADACRAYLGEALEQLRSASVELALDPDWMSETLRHLERVALIAAAWKEGEASLDEAITRIPADLGSTVRGAVETTGSFLDRWGLPLLGIGVVVAGAVAVRRVVGR